MKNLHKRNSFERVNELWLKNRTFVRTKVKHRSLKIIKAEWSDPAQRLGFTRSILIEPVQQISNRRGGNVSKQISAVD